jgi:hypothetical protein
MTRQEMWTYLILSQQLIGDRNIVWLPESLWIDGVMHTHIWAGMADAFLEHYLGCELAR